MKDTVYQVVRMLEGLSLTRSEASLLLSVIRNGYGPYAPKYADLRMLDEPTHHLIAVRNKEQGMALVDVANERDRQDKKWGTQQNLVDGERYLILGEEFGEVGRAVMEKGSLSEELRTELIQVAAVAVKWVEMIDNARKTLSGQGKPLSES